MQYRRADIPGARYFFTVNLLDRKSHLLTDQIDLLRACLRKVKSNHPFTIDAMVILPEHLHTLWTLPKDDANFSLRWSLIKASFSRGITRNEATNQSRIKKRERGIWQRRFWEHVIRDDQDYENHVNYIHYNPVKHGYVNAVKQWPHSSFHRYVKEGVLEEDWGSNISFDQTAWGEA